jgi:hypothetical protein
MATETCFAFKKPVFQPAMRIISAITNANPAQITTTFAHNYITGTIVRVNIPPAIVGAAKPGMPQINGLVGTISVNSPTSFLINIDTTYFDPFVVPMATGPGYTCSQVIPVGEVTSMLTAAVQNVLPY